MAVYYNEIDAYAAEWLRNLMKEGLIPDGEVDTRSIVDVRSSDLRGFKQCHFFAGIAGWSHALRLAGWADDREIWTGSAPCQPFSVAGKGKGTEDERHLWPVFFDLIRECRPSVVMGEQVASKAGRDWFSGVRSDLEDVGYAVGGADLCAAGVGAPHIRQRLYWVALADADSRDPRAGRRNDGEMRGVPAAERRPEDGAVVFGRGGEGHRCSDMGDADDARPQGHGRPVEQHDAPRRQEPDGRSAAPSVGDMADADGGDTSAERQQCSGQFGFQSQRRSCAGDEAEQQRASFWADAIWLTGADGKARRAPLAVRVLDDGLSAELDRLGPGEEPEILPLLIKGETARANKLRALGNAIVPPLAAEVVRAFMEAVDA